MEAKDKSDDSVGTESGTTLRIEPLLRYGCADVADGRWVPSESRRAADEEAWSADWLTSVQWSMIPRVFACCDESGIDGASRWWAFGVLWLSDDSVLPQFEADITALRQRRKCYGEFKWSKLTKTMRPTYSDFLSVALALPDLQFTSMIVDSHELDPKESKKYHADEKEAYLKFMRMLVQKRLPVMVDAGHRDFTMVYDKLSVKGGHKRRFREFLLGDMERVALGKGVDCKYLHLSQGNSAAVSLLQAADLLTGATRATWAGETGGPQGAAKRDLCSQIETWAGTTLLDFSRGWNRYYNLFWMRFDKTRKQR
jgi:Protein of unknown function (DUF3800)